MLVRRRNHQRKRQSPTEEGAWMDEVKEKEEEGKEEAPPN